MRKIKMKSKLSCTSMAAFTFMLSIFLVLLTGCPPEGALVVEVTGVSVEDTNINIEVGDTVTLVAVVTPAEAINRNITWSANDTRVASVSASTDNPFAAVVTGVSAGVAIITVTTDDGGFTAECVINVTSPAGIDTPTYSVTYDGNENTGGDVPVDDNEYEEGSEVTVLGNTGFLVLTGQTFGGWNRAGDGSDEAYAEGATFTMPAEDVTLYAQWTHDEYTVSFNTQGGSNVASQTIVHGEHVTEPSAPTLTGYIFSGWYTDEDYPTLWDFDSDTVTGPLTLVAEWTPEEYTVTFNSHEGSAVDSQTVEYGGLVSEPSDPTKSNHLFGGWYTAEDYQTLWNFASDTVTEDITVHAAWIPEFAKLISPNPIADSCFGTYVAIDGDYMITSTFSVLPFKACIFHHNGNNLWDQGFEIASPNAYSDAFGRAIDICGDYAVIGAPGENSQIGAVYIYHRTGTNTWEQVAHLIPQDPGGTIPRFGSSVAITEDYVAVGAKGEQYPDPNMPEYTISDGGAVYFFDRTESDVWEYNSKKIITDFPYNYMNSHELGFSIDASGDYVVAGAPGHPFGFNNQNQYGAAYVYFRNETGQWDDGCRLQAPNPENFAEFGSAVSISGDYVLVGEAERGPAGSSTSDSGAAYIYHRIGSNSWSAGTQLPQPTVRATEHYGYDLDLEGTELVIGGQLHTAYSFSYNGSTWSLIDTIVSPETGDEDLFGLDVAVSDGFYVFSAPLDDTAASNAGAVFVKALVQ